MEGSVASPISPDAAPRYTHTHTQGQPLHLTAAVLILDLFKTEL